MLFVPRNLPLKPILPTLWLVSFLSIFVNICAAENMSEENMSESARSAKMSPSDSMTPPPILLGGYMSGNWYNPSQGGHGFQLELTSTHEMIAIWFVYTPDGSGQSWIYAESFWDPTKSTVTLPAIILTGARFPPNFNSADVHRQQPQGWGTITFSFSDCNHGTVSWHSDAAGYNNANDTPLPISRLTDIDGASCPQ